MSTPPQIKGYELVRLLSDRERTKLFIAKTIHGFCAVKFQIPTEPSKLAELLKRDALLRELSRNAGFTEILDCGETEEGWIWEALTLADNVPSTPRSDLGEELENYTPFTLGSWHLIHGQPSAKQVAQWGIRLAEALGLLHRAGLVHRDVKPPNILFISGEPCLGDYELVGPPGEEIDYRGTEGYRPIEGTNDVGADLFGLGKTLYETWTGRSRLEFPSIPKSILQDPEWSNEGGLLNEVICRVCDPQLRRRFLSADQLSAAFSNVVALHRPLNRRRWLIGAASGIGVGLAAILIRKSHETPAQVAWRCVREKGFGVEAWTGSSWSVDWNKGEMYSARIMAGGALAFQSLDLQDFTLVSKELPQNLFINDCRCILHPHTRELWLWEGGIGKMAALNTETLELRALGGGPDDRRHFGGGTYWNPITNRVGIWGGYGMMSMTNSRFEFDTTRNEWLELEQEGAKNSPCRRGPAIPLVPNLTGEKLFLVGGSGSSSGKQGDRMVGLRAFDGRFHALDDIWELNLLTNQWNQLLPLGYLNPSRLRGATFLPKLNALVVFESGEYWEQHVRPAQTWLLRLGVDNKPILLPAVGNIPQLSQTWGYTVDPSNQETLVLADDGIFRAAIEPA